MTRKFGRTELTLIVFATNLILFVLLTAPFKLWVAASELTQMRPAAALTPVLGMIFGWPAAFGCAAGNLVCDLASGYEFSYAVFNSFLQILYAMSAYFFWRRINRKCTEDKLRLNSVAKILKFCLMLGINACLTVICTSVLNHAYNVVDLFSADNFFLFVNSFDSGLLFGVPLLILGHMLNSRIESMKIGSEKTAARFTMNERMILNTLITGFCICILVGTIVYLTDKFGADSNIGILGRIYIFETLAMNIYFALSIGFMCFTEQKISRPIEKLAQIAGGYYAGNVTTEERRQMIDACKVYANESTEVGDLARSYISMNRDLEKYVENLRNVMAEKERVNAELTLASDIQANMLPCIFPPFPEHSEFNLYAMMHPAKEVGGDFYDFFMIGEDKLAVIVADVSGKGVPAALFMVITKTLIKNYTQTGIEPAEVFTTVNRTLCDSNDAGLFVTAWMGVLEISKGTLTYVNAGHNPPLIKKADGEFEYLRERTGFVLAGMEDIKYRQNTLKLAPGDRIFLYTDGVTETNDSKQELYGEVRLQEFLNSHAECSTEKILQSLQTDLQIFAGNAPQFDDITMLLLDFKGAGTMKERIYKATDENVADMLGFVEDELEKSGCSIKSQNAICVAMEEIFVNIAHYAYPNSSGNVKVAIGIDDDTDVATFIVSDTGIAFNPLEKDDPDVTLSAEERKIGGLGIFMIKKLMDSVAYVRENEENRLTMIKKLERSSGNDN